MITVVMPSRGRPVRAWEAVDAALDLAELDDTRVILAVDMDDPELPGYTRYRDYRVDAEVLVLEPEQTGNLVKATNTVSLQVAAADPTGIIGNLGDDHVARTKGWDRYIADALASPGIAYGDDLFQRERLPTAPFMSASIVLALGWYAQPDLTHLFIDNVWRDLGAQTGCLHYLPEVVIEHLHPLAGKADWDGGYVKVNRQPAVDVDAAAYHVWRDGSMVEDVDKVRASLG